ncbi:hypothetical protein NUW54_g2636 [Trametes sanguinea]|uniref:Uncharacterized protein n=1 Tax=Trametes sanguinea TaxID=158606 RepID=A0ACC1Q310_9APHY|nr:hypothetical protein NUW54_g2636 [Trametes sanguinea]
MKSFCPVEYRYAVIQMDPVGMIKHFNDPVALNAASTMTPKKYLVYLERPIGLPPPTDPWFRYDVSPIGTTLRPEDEAKGITSDMVIPIFPNTFHPSGERAPIRTHPTFPFNNCYHWIRNRRTVRIRRKAIRYDDAHAFKVNVFQHMEIDKSFGADYDRINAFLHSKHTSEPSPFTHNDSGDLDRSESPSLDGSPQLEGENDLSSVIADDVDTLPGAPTRTGSPDSGYPPSEASSEASRDSVAALIGMDILGLNMDDTVEFLPLVDMWYEITDHLTADTIPSPVEFYEECDTIMRIIHDARERAPSDFPPSPFVDNGVEIDYDAISSSHSMHTDDCWRDELNIADPELLRRYGIKVEPRERLTSRRGPMNSAWRVIRQGAAKLFRTLVPWRNRPPCLPYWT